MRKNTVPRAAARQLLLMSSNKAFEVVQGQVALQPGERGGLLAHKATVLATTRRRASTVLAAHVGSGCQRGVPGRSRCKHEGHIGHSAGRSRDCGGTGEAAIPTQREGAIDPLALTTGPGRRRQRSCHSRVAHSVLAKWRRPSG